MEILRKRGRPRKDAPEHSTVGDAQESDHQNAGVGETGESGVESHAIAQRKANQEARRMAALRAVLTGKSFLIRKH